MRPEIRGRLAESMPERRRDEIRVGNQRGLRLTDQRTFVEPQHLNSRHGQYQHEQAQHDEYRAQSEPDPGQQHSQVPA